jgi:chemotaxis protein methyltransferase CheR
MDRDVPEDLAARLLAVERSLARACGPAFTERLRERWRAHALAAARETGADPSELWPPLVAGAPERVAALLEEAIAGETWFFRHPAQLAALERLFRQSDPVRPLRLWSAGCASGEEPYGLAMALLEAGRRGGHDRVLGTDVSERALEHARDAAYGAWSFRRDPGYLARWFRGELPRREVAPEARALVRFRRHDLAAEPMPPGGFDVVVCRGVLGHLEAEACARALRSLHGALRPGGFLLVAPGETALLATLPLEWLERGGATLLRRPEARGRRAARRAGRDEAQLSLFEEAREAVRRGDVAEAGRLAARAAERERSPRSYLLLGMTSEARGDVAGAVEAVQQALHLDAQLAVGHASLLPLYRRLGRRADAERARRAALEALHGLDEGQRLTAVEPVTAGALRRALEQAAA